ncbi:nucleotide exchange factor GrpE [Bacillus ginsengihumi]|uniref:Protein GrpE n=1 Tax=Heyndrickxia ginsengihumi TaxID=363870 RepID=A0A0A6VF62_9BACI|nr:nucleotide exchange factor GrpE [Heyndrickxia ginsengihumi]KHD85209.1 heat shock protein GrpE [Heyndrickxia ginsengihumi]NEY19715.1 nucleotide exchange factor GrpE [Heyndrickxia ginsengihumi]
MAEEKNNQQVENQQSEENEQSIEPIFAEELTEENTNEQEQTAAETSNEKDELEKANAKIKELEAKIDEYENRYVRLRADFDNFRRRVDLDKQASEKYRAQHLITNLLPAIDNFERALQMAPEDEQTKQLLQGMEMVYRNILEALKKEGVEPIEALGKEFDPHYHQAIMQAQEEDVESNIIVEEFQKGYILKDRVIRPSMVKVNQ